MKRWHKRKRQREAAQIYRDTFRERAVALKSHVGNPHFQSILRSDFTISWNKNSKSRHSERTNVKIERKNNKVRLPDSTGI